MSRLNKLLVLCSLLLIAPTILGAQNCNLSISGYVTDLSKGAPISYANIYIQELGLGAVSDSVGFFKINPVCADKYHVRISYLGSETKTVFLKVERDTTLTVVLGRSRLLLDEAEIIDHRSKVYTQASESLGAADIAQNSEKDLAQMLERISGVSTIKNGAGISKPIVHGLYGNRLAILNNGVVQSGQQWGVDHSPEIDPLMANKITVIKGVGAMEYPGNSLGSIILVEPKKIAQDPHLHGEAKYTFQSNGLASGLHLDLRHYNKIVAWRLSGTLKKSGDNRTSRYLLRNTGHQQANVSLQLEKTWSDKLFSEIYVSTFNAEIGVLRGAHIGNITDLESALARDTPFYTEKNFSYSIDAPSQLVNHHLFKLRTRYTINTSQWIDVTLAAQFNFRKEFDIRRGDKSDVPALSLAQSSAYGEYKYENRLPKNWIFKVGIQTNEINNENVPETGILPLIPNYLTYEYGLFSILTKKLEKTTLEIGGRYDLENRKVAYISNSVPRAVVNTANKYTNISAMGGASRELGKDWTTAINIGYAARNPEVNELYSNGLHQGVSGIEEGDPNLDSEVSTKGTFSLKGHLKHRLFFEGLFYYQKIGNYIFLNPQDEIRLTIRGAFPVFKYEQTLARLAGFDFSTTYQISDQLDIAAQYSFLKGDDLTNNTPLVFMPSNNLYARLNYSIPKLGKFQNVGFEINNRFVFAQKHLLASQDFVSPPATYSLMGLRVSAEKQYKKMRLNIFARAENLFNSAYRDYLNRQRYFADGLGINLTIGLNVSF